MKQTLVIIPSHGKFVWTPALNLLDYVLKGSRSAVKTWHLNANQNNEDGAMRKIGSILRDEWS